MGCSIRLPILVLLVVLTEHPTCSSRTFDLFVPTQSHPVVLVLMASSTLEVSPLTRTNHSEQIQEVFFREGWYLAGHQSVSSKTSESFVQTSPGVGSEGSLAFGASMVRGRLMLGVGLGEGPLVLGIDGSCLGLSILNPGVLRAGWFGWSFSP